MSYRPFETPATGFLDSLRSLEMTVRATLRSLEMTARATLRSLEMTVR